MRKILDGDNIIDLGVGGRGVRIFFATLAGRCRADIPAVPIFQLSVPMLTRQNRYIHHLVDWGVLCFACFYTGNGLLQNSEAKMPNFR